MWFIRVKAGKKIVKIKKLEETSPFCSAQHWGGLDLEWISANVQCTILQCQTLFDAAECQESLNHKFLSWDLGSLCWNQENLIRSCHRLPRVSWCVQQWVWTQERPSTLAFHKCGRWDCLSLLICILQRQDQMRRKEWLEPLLLSNDNSTHKRERRSRFYLFSSMCFAFACEIRAGLREPRPLSKRCSGVWSVEKLFLWANKCFISLSEAEALQHFGWKHLPAEHLMPGN